MFIYFLVPEKQPKKWRWNEKDIVFWYPWGMEILKCTVYFLYLFSYWIICISSLAAYIEAPRNEVCGLWDQNYSQEFLLYSLEL